MKVPTNHRLLTTQKKKPGTIKEPSSPKGSRKTDPKSKKVEFDSKSSSQGASGQLGGRSGQAADSSKQGVTSKDGVVTTGSDKDPLWSEVRAASSGSQSNMHSSQNGIAEVSRGGFSFASASFAPGSGASSSGDVTDSFASALFSMRLITLEMALQKLMGKLQEGGYASSMYGVEDVKGSVETVLLEAGKELHLKVTRMFEQARVVLKRAEGSALCISKESSDDEMQQLRSALMMPEVGTASMKVDGTTCAELQRKLEGRQQAMQEANERWLRQVLGDLGLKNDFDANSVDYLPRSIEPGFSDPSLGGTTPGSRATTPGGVHRNLMSGSRATTPGGTQRFDASESGDDLNDTGYRQVVKGVRRRIFEEVMTEEREKIMKRAEEEFATKCEVGGMAELAHLVRRIEDMNLRRALCKALKDYGRRLPSTIEVVCKFCRRKVKKEDVHSYNVPQYSSEFLNQSDRPHTCPSLSHTHSFPNLASSGSNLDLSQNADVSGHSINSTSSLQKSSTLPLQTTLLPPGHPKSSSNLLRSGSVGKDEFRKLTTVEDFIVDGRRGAA